MMLELLPALVPILLVDILKPVLFAMLVFAAGSNRPISNSTAMLVGHTLAYFVAVSGEPAKPLLEEINPLLGRARPPCYVHADLHAELARDPVTKIGFIRTPGWFVQLLAGP
jgi:hypothetical protein